MRVRSNQELDKLSEGLRGNLVPVFKYEPGNTYNMIPVTDAEGQQVVYWEATHNVKIGTQGGRVRCVKDYVDATPDPLDPNRPKNDGTCPYCDVAFKAAKVAKAALDEWQADNPNASKDDIAARRMVINNNKPVGSRDSESYYLMAKLDSADSLGKNLKLDETDGMPAFRLVLVKITSSQYKNKFKPLIDEFDGIIDYKHIVFRYPEGEGNNDRSKKMSSAKDMTISAPAKGAEAIFSQYQGLKEKIAAKVAELEKVDDKGDCALNHLDEKLFSFQPKSILTIQKELAAVSSEYDENMTDEEKAALAAKLESNSVSATAVGMDDLKSKFNLGGDEEASTEEGFNVGE